MAKIPAQSKPKSTGNHRRRLGGIARRLAPTKPKGSSR